MPWSPVTSIWLLFLFFFLSSAVGGAGRPFGPLDPSSVGRREKAVVLKLDRGKGDRWARREVEMRVRVARRGAWRVNCMAVRRVRRKRMSQKTTLRWFMCEVDPRCFAVVTLF